MPRVPNLYYTLLPRGRTSFPTPALRATTLRLALAIAANPTEIAFFLDDAGVITAAAHGTHDTVGFPTKTWEDSGGRHFLHNHPAGQGPSDDDLRMACHYNLASMHIVAKTYPHGSAVLYTLRPGELGSWDITTWRKTIRPIMRSLIDETEVDLLSAHHLGNLSKQSTRFMFWPVLWSRVAEKAGLSFTIEHLGSRARVGREATYAFTDAYQKDEDIDGHPREVQWTEESA